MFRVTSYDPLGHEQAPSVAKLGPRKLISAERVAFETVEGVLLRGWPNFYLLPSTIRNLTSGD